MREKHGRRFPHVAVTSVIQSAPLFCHYARPYVHILHVKTGTIHPFPPAPLTDLTRNTGASYPRSYTYNNHTPRHRQADVEHIERVSCNDCQYTCTAHIFRSNQLVSVNVIVLIWDFSEFWRRRLLGLGEQPGGLVFHQQLRAEGREPTLRLLLLRSLRPRGRKFTAFFFFFSYVQPAERGWTNDKMRLALLAIGRACESKLQRDAGATATAADEEEGEEVQSRRLQPAEEPVGVVARQCEFRVESRGQIFGRSPLEHSGLDRVHDSTGPTGSAEFGGAAGIHRGQSDQQER